MREAMHGLAQEIVASHEARAAGLESLRRDISAQRERALCHLQEIASNRQSARVSLQTSLKGMASRRRATAGRLREHLARGLVELQKARTQRRAATRAGLHGVASQRRRIAQEQRRNLFREIRGFLRQAATARKVEARQLRETLSLAKADLVQAGAQRRPVVEVWLSGLTSDRLAARHEWHQMILALQKRRPGVIAPEAPTPTPPREKAAKEVSAVAAEVKAAKRATRSSKGGRRRSGRGH